DLVDLLGRQPHRSAPAAGGRGVPRRPRHLRRARRLRRQADRRSLHLVAHREPESALGAGLLGGRRQHLGDELDHGLHPRRKRTIAPMIPAPELLLFFGLVFGIVILPGLDMAFILGSALVGGRATGFAAIVGIVGIAIVLQLFPAAFAALLVVGAAYMAWIGVSIWRSGATLGAPEGAIPPSRAATFRRGALTNILNPKAYAFMLAIFPQFVRPDRGPIATQALELATIITATQIGVYGTLVCAADRARWWLALHPKVERGLAKGVGALLVACAIWSAAEGWRHLTGN